MSGDNDSKTIMTALLPSGGMDEQLELYTLRDQLEQKAADLADFNGGTGRQFANNYMAKLQKPDLSPQELVQATKEFTAHFPMGRAGAPGSGDGTGNLAAANVLNDMDTRAKDFASKYYIATPGEDSAPPVADPRPLNPPPKPGGY